MQLIDLSNGLEDAVKTGGSGNNGGDGGGADGCGGAGAGAGAGGGGGAGAGAGGSAGGSGESGRGSDALNASGGQGAVGGGGGGGGDSNFLDNGARRDDEELAAVPWASLSRGGGGEGDTEQQEAVRPVAPSEVPPGPQRAEGEQATRRRGPDGFYQSGGGFQDGAVGDASSMGEWGAGDGRGGDGGGVGGAAAPPPPAVAEPREDMKPAEVLRVVARGVRAEFKTLQWACRQVGMIIVSCFFLLRVFLFFSLACCA